MSAQPISPTGEALILQRLDELHGTIKEVRGTVKDVKALAEATNGRVRTIELWKERIAGMSLTIKAVPVLVSVLAGTASIVALIIAITNG